MTPDDQNGQSKTKTDSWSDLKSSSSRPMSTLSTDSMTATGGTPKVVSNKGITLEDEIGRGGYSVVYRARHKDGTVMACKRFDLTSETNKRWIEKNLKPEMKLSKKLTKLNHPNVIKTYEVIKTTRHGFIFMQLARNGSIGDILEKTKQPIEENKCKQWFKQIASAVKYLHEKGIAHRDIKPENFLLDNDSQTVLLADFGFAVQSLNDDKIMKGTKCGTEEYSAPEIITLVEGKSYDAKKVDMWSLGVSLYEMLNYVMPFPVIKEMPTSRRIQMMQRKHFFKNSKISVQPSGLAIDCYTKLLEFDIKKRLSSQQLVAHQWLK